MSQVILITGCSTGIGRDLAERLSRAGYTVVATARRVEALDGLAAALQQALALRHVGSVEPANNVANCPCGKYVHAMAAG